MLKCEKYEHKARMLRFIELHDGGYLKILTNERINDELAAVEVNAHERFHSGESYDSNDPPPTG